jgi:hypothetical protein
LRVKYTYHFNLSFHQGGGNAWGVAVGRYVVQVKVKKWEKLVILTPGACAATGDLLEAPATSTLAKRPQGLQY